ncbi:MAG: 16S rRNA (uracil(1498)-N(3))-methyltransferase [Planctomycetes bacterium]|nr:16S rRNA (uracil(1498)-N(3))-methyltransferase [Planctomycetota bacterium]
MPTLGRRAVPSALQPADGMANRYFVEALPAVGRHELPEDVAHHLARVLRCRPGDPVRLGDGAGGTADAVVATADKRGVAVDVQACRREPAPPVALTLAFALPRLQRTEWLLEHGTELGVAAFQPIWTARTRPGNERPERWQRIVNAAAGQCDRAWLPLVQPACELADLLARTDSGTRLLASPAGAPSRPLDAGRATLLVGPEGGFSDDELAAIAAAGYAGVRFGGHILRTETAAMVGAALLLAR